MTRSLAQFFSILFHPLFIPSYLFALLLYGAPEALGLENIRGKALLLGFIAVYTGLFPAILIGWMAKQGLIQSIQLKLLKDRALPYLVTALLYVGFACYVGYQSRMMWVPAWLLGGSAAVIASLGLISLKWQISAHAAGMGGLTGVLGWYCWLGSYPSLWPFWLLALVFSGAILSSRLALQAHTPSQIWAGFFVGLMVQTTCIAWIMPNLLK